MATEPWLEFHLTLAVAKKCLVSIDVIKRTKYTTYPANIGDLYGLNEDLQMYNIPRTIKPRRTLTFDQVVMLAITPKEARTELLKTFLSPSDS